ncbi:MAG: TIGR03557 family F420-dependent LLM class oxidoreductase [Methanocella sp.]
MVKLGLQLGPEQNDPLELLDQSVAAEQAGFETLLVDDHFHPWDPVGQSCYTWSWLGAAAARLNGIEMGTGVTCPILRYNPAIIAQAAATIDRMSPGPVYLGVGTGESLNEYPTTGEWPDYDTRQDMLREAIELIRALWTGAEVTFDGDYFALRKARLYTPPRRDIPIYISSLVPGSAYFAGQHGDGLISVANPPDVMREIIANFSDGARAEGKDPGQMPKIVLYNAAYTDDADAAVKIHKKYWASTVLRAMYLEKIYTPEMSATNGAMVGDDTIRSHMCISTDPDEHARFAQRFIDAGFNQLYVHSSGPDQLDFIRNYGQNVLPLLRKKNPAEAPARGVA